MQNPQMNTDEVTDTHRYFQRLSVRICDLICVHLWGILLTGTLAIAFGLIGVDALHAVEQVFGIGAFDRRLARPRLVAAGARRGIAWQLTTACFIGQKFVFHDGQCGT